MKIVEKLRKKICKKILKIILIEKKILLIITNFQSIF